MTQNHKAKSADPQFMFVLEKSKKRNIGLCDYSVTMLQTQCRDIIPSPHLVTPHQRLMNKLENTLHHLLR